MRCLRFAVQPSWLALHLAAVTMILLGRWQLTVSEDKGFSLQNFGYALRWWAFSVFVFGMWARSMRDAFRKYNATTTAPGEATPEPVTKREPQAAYRRYVMPTSVPQHADDPLHYAYNVYLARLAVDVESDA